MNLISYFMENQSFNLVMMMIFLLKSANFKILSNLVNIFRFFSTIARGTFARSNLNLNSSKQLKSATR